MAKDNLISLAKGSGGKKPLSAPTKKPVVKVVEKTKEELRNEKVKETVEKLLKDVDVELTPKAELEAFEEEITGKVAHGEGIEWLEEQVAGLTEQNEQLRVELGIAKEDYAKLFEKMQIGGGANTTATETILQNILFFFNEMQSNYLGDNPQGIKYLYAYPERLLPKLIQLFPFLENYRKF